MLEIRDLAVRHGRGVPALRGGQTLDVDGGVTVVRQ